MHQKGFKEILPKEPTCGLKGLSWVRLGLSWVRIIFPTILFLENHKIILLITDNKLIKQ